MPLVRQRSVVCSLSRPGMGRARAGQPRPVGKADSRRVSGGPVLDHHPAQRDAFRAAFAGFDPQAVARFTETDVARLLADPGIVRHRGKIEGAIASARAWERIEAREGFEGFSDWLWRYVDGVPLQPRPQGPADIPVQTPLSQRLSKDLKAAGFTFCGPTIVYAFLQATGLVNDHLVTCPAHDRVAAQGR